MYAETAKPIVKPRKKLTKLSPDGFEIIKNFSNKFTFFAEMRYPTNLTIYEEPSMLQVQVVNELF